MNSGKIRSLMASTALLGPMTPIERRHGRYMRAPDHDQADAEFAAFEKAGEVEVGSKDAIESNVPEPKPADEKPEKPAKAPRKAAAEKPAAEEKPEAKEPPAEEEKPEEEDGEEEGDEEEEAPKPKKRVSDRIRELTAGRRSDRRIIEQLSARLETLEKGGLQERGGGGNTAGTGSPAPDPTDAAKYPLGHLDDRYVEDKLEWLAEQKTSQRADAVLQRQQEIEQEQATEKARSALREKVDDLKTRGSDISDDFEEAVIDAGIRGDWDLGQVTFEAAHEADHGAQILYELSQDTKEATRVAKLSPFQQMKFVMDRNAEISAKTKPRTKPAAGAPPSTSTRGANSSHRINPATDNLADFEKAWLADEKGR